MTLKPDTSLGEQWKKWPDAPDFNRFGVYVAYSPIHGFIVCHFETGKGLCTRPSESISAWFGTTHVMELKIP